MSSHWPGLHPDQASYVDIRRHRELYVDKTSCFATLLALKPGGSPQEPSLETKYVFLARPRRFGKSLLVATLEAWFQGISADWETPGHHDPKPDWLFADTAGFNSWHKQAIRPVIRLDMSSVGGNTVEEVRSTLLDHLGSLYVLWARRGVNLSASDIVWEYTNDVPWAVVLHERTPPHIWFRSLLQGLYAHYRLKPVVLIDKYDAPVTRLLEDEVEPTTRTAILGLLRDFYRVLKSEESSLHFVFITGVSRFGKTSLFSALNNLTDISQDVRYAPLCGFTEQEVSTYLIPYLDQIAHNIGGALQTLQDMLRDYYNGYQFAPYGEDSHQVYNPFTLLSFLHEWRFRKSDQAWRERQLTNHWANAGNSALLIRLIERGQYDPPPVTPALNRLSRVSYDLDHLDYTALMLQTGYYTFHFGEDRKVSRYSWTTPTGKSGMPICSIFGSIFMGQGPDGRTTTDCIFSTKPCKTRIMNLFAMGSCSSFQYIPGDKLREESAFHIIMDVLRYVMQLEYASEVLVWGGRLDQVHEFPGHVCVIELKYNKTAEEALHQIETKGYADRFRDRNCRLTALGLNFVKDSTEDSPRIEYASRTLYDPGTVQ